MLVWKWQLHNSEVLGARLDLSGETASRVRVLVVEDDPDSRELYSELLQDLYDVRLAVDATEGLARFLSERPDVVITDQTLPGRSGTALARELKRHWPDIKVVLVSGHAKVDHAEACDLVLPKPIDIDQLTRAIDSLARPPRR